MLTFFYFALAQVLIVLLCFHSLAGRKAWVRFTLGFKWLSLKLEAGDAQLQPGDG